MKFKSPVFSESSGSIGGMTYSHNWAGRYVRERVTPTNPASSYQQAIRTAMSYLTNRWKNTLSAAQRAAWALYASNVQMLDALGDPIYNTGLNHYVRSNSQAKAEGSPVIDDAPDIFDLGTLSALTASNFVPGPPSTIDINFAEGDDWHQILGGLLMIFAARPQSPTINYFKGPYRWAHTFTQNESTPVNIQLPFPAVVGQRIFFRGIARCSDARLSSEVAFQLDA